VDQAIAGIVKIDCRGPNVVGYGVSRLLQMREKAGTVAVYELVKRFQKGR
jgi:hypothetical protein